MKLIRLRSPLSPLKCMTIIPVGLDFCNFGQPEMTPRKLSTLFLSGFIFQHKDSQGVVKPHYTLRPMGAFQCLLRLTWLNSIWLSKAIKPSYFAWPGSGMKGKDGKGMQLSRWSCCNSAAKLGHDRCLMKIEALKWKEWLPWKMQRNLSDGLHGHSSNSRQLEPSNRNFAVHRMDVGHGIIRQEIIYCTRKQVSWGWKGQTFKASQEVQNSESNTNQWKIGVHGISVCHDDDGLII